MIVEFIKAIPLKSIGFWQCLLSVLQQNGSERKSWRYINFSTNTEGSFIFIGLVIYILFAKYINGRFYSCLEYENLCICNVSHNSSFHTRNIISFNGLSSIFSPARPIKLMVLFKYLSVNIKIIDSHEKMFILYFHHYILFLICFKVSRALALSLSNYNGLANRIFEKDL